MQIPLLSSTVSGRSKNVTAQLRQNVFLDVVKYGDKTNVYAYGTPGLLSFADLGSQPARGLWWVQSRDQLFVVNGPYLFKVDRFGSFTNVGTLSTNIGRVGMADNGTQLCIVDGNNGYIYNVDTGVFTKITAAGFNGADTVVFLDSYFIVSVPNSSPGKFQISGQYDGLTWNALDFAYAESNPDGITAVATDNSNLAIFGDISAELWNNTGALDFPFQRMAGASLEYGLAAKWSLARLAGAPTMLLRNRRGQFTIGQLNGYSYTPISTTELDYLINNYRSPEDATAFTYFHQGHEFYQITFQGEGKTWLYDANSGSWSTLKAYGKTRHRAQLSASFGNKIIVSDYENGKLYSLDVDTYTDDGEPIERELIAPHGYDNGHINQIRCTRLRLDMEGGIGLTTGQGSNPQIMLQISRNGGHSYGSELWRDIGKIGEYKWRAEWTRLGIARDWVFKIRMTDPVKFAVLNAYADIDIANK